MACQIKVSVKVVKRGVETVQVPGSDPALGNCSSWPEKLSLTHERQAGTQAALRSPCEGSKKLQYSATIY